MSKILLTTAYFPPVAYMALLLRPEPIYLEAEEHYRKQSFRNRMAVLTANGPQTLSIPVVQKHQKMMIKEVEIDYKTEWQRHHWRTIEMAYNNSPFFIYYRDFLAQFYEKKIKYLWDFNRELLAVILKLLRTEKEIFYTEQFVENDETASIDARYTIHPKLCGTSDYPFKADIPYRQVFEEKFGFTPALSVLDLLCNKGNESKSYLLATGIDER